MFNLFVYCLFSCALKIATAGYGHFTMSNTLSNTDPVCVGDTATLTCTAHPDRPDSFQPMYLYWTRVNYYWPLIIDLGNDAYCNVFSMPTSPHTVTLSDTFEPTCDTEHHQYTLSIVNVTESDLRTTWCCSFDGARKECAKVTKAMETSSVTPRNRIEASRIPEVTGPSGIPEVTESSTTAARGTMPGSSCQLWILLFAVLIYGVNF